MSDDPDDFLEEMGLIGDAFSLGPCCICETDVGVTAVCLLERRCVVAGHGWGCFVCNLPCDGASAVLCDFCLGEFQAGRASLRFACRGYPATDGRVAIGELPAGAFRHDEAAHAG